MVYGEGFLVPDDVVQGIAENTVLRVGIIVFAVGMPMSVLNPPSNLGVLVRALIVLDALQMFYRLNYVITTGSLKAMFTSFPPAGWTYCSPVKGSPFPNVFAVRLMCVE